ncbi:hypothetical protein POM88_045156 [Heracleum sosnowskyi]|uniref:Transposase (putative) gypsy type domain-containing protein n=1 Tax=Heracleum sosnowskyi TaxID=360622 RepID=A0AAD8H421_9APIA|nr:hypothetical protein POM88_045156 [Heracleum sosnowskyi]
MDQPVEYGPFYSAMAHFSASRFPSANLNSVMTEAEVRSMPEKYDIGSSLFRTWAADETDLIYHTPTVAEEFGSVALGVSERAFFCGLRLPLLPVLKKLLRYTSVALGQLDPNTFIHINTFQNRCLKAGVRPRLSLLLHHFDFRKNGKSVGFYQLSRRTGRPDWGTTNSSNRGTHDHWFYISGHKLVKYSVWREVDPALVTAPELSNEDRADYSRLYRPQEPNRIPLAVSRDKTWLRALWGTVSTRSDMIKRLQAKNAQKLAAAAARKTAEDSAGTSTAASPPGETEHRASGAEENIIDTTVDDVEIINVSDVGRTSAQKRPRVADGEAVSTYRPEWSIMTTDRFGVPAPAASKELGVDLCRAFVLPQDRPVYDNTDALGACSELIGHVALVVPWVATVEQKVKDLGSQLRGLKLTEERAEAAEAQLDSLHKEVASLQQRLAQVMTDRDSVKIDLDAAFVRLNRVKSSLRASRKSEKKAQKLVLLSEDRGFTAGFEEVIRKAHAAGMDHKLLLEEGMEDPIGRPEEPDVPPVVSSDPESEMSD